MIEYIIVFIFITLLGLLYFINKSRVSYKKKFADSLSTIYNLNQEIYKLKDYINKMSKNNKKLFRTNGKLKKEMQILEKNNKVNRNTR